MLLLRLCSDAVAVLSLQSRGGLFQGFFSCNALQLLKSNGRSIRGLGTLTPDDARPVGMSEGQLSM